MTRPHDHLHSQPRSGSYNGSRTATETVQTARTALLLPVYLGFLAIGFPEALLGASWPAMGAGVGQPIASVAWIAVGIASSTLVASLCTEPWLSRLGMAATINIGAVLSVLALVGFSCSTELWQLMIFSLPYGFGAGMLTVALNAYVAVRYASAHINWMHAATAFGALVGHTVLGFVIAETSSWHMAYRVILIIQAVLAVILCCCSRAWAAGQQFSQPSSRQDSQQFGQQYNQLSDQQISQQTGEEQSTQQTAQLSNEQPAQQYGRQDSQQSLRQSLANAWYPQREWRHDVRTIVHPPLRVLVWTGVPALLMLVFAYGAVEQTTMLWASSYMVHADHMTIHTAGIYANLFFVGLVAGCIAAGLASSHTSDGVRLVAGVAVIAAAMVVMLVPFPGHWRAFTAPILLGLGCAPINPAVIHLTPRLWGKEATARLIGFETAMVSLATLVAPASFALVEAPTSMHMLPWYLLAFTVLLAICTALTLRFARRRLQTESSSAE